MKRRPPPPDARLTHVRSLDLAGGSQRGRRAHIAAASGIVSVGEFRYVIADDEHHVGVFPRRGHAAGRLVRVRAGRLPLGHEARKRRKPDFEAITALPAFDGCPDGALLLVPSGSRANRCLGALLPLESDGSLSGHARTVDLRAIYGAIGTAFPLNIEGAFVQGTHLALMQRAHKGSAINARIRIALVPLLEALADDRPPSRSALFDMHTFSLGSIGDVPLGFTDAAALPFGGFAFTAVAEDTGNAYADGDCVGAAIGIVDRHDRIVAQWRLQPPLKVEGIEAIVSGPRARIDVVTDADDACAAARLLTTSIVF